MAKAIDERKGTPGDLRRGLMLYGSTAAMAAALMLAEGGLGPALAQDIGPRISPTVSAQGDFTVPGPSPTPFFETRSGTLDIVRVNRDAVLNWQTYDGAPPGGVQGNAYVNFLPAETELRFVGRGESFTAINRVFTTPDQAGNYRGIAFQGRVTSYLFGDGPNSVGPVGGNIWFYSPGGILATASSSFNVGSLVLSASDLDNFQEYGTARQVEFTGVADPFASVILQPGARVTLNQPNSSFGIFAPTIEQGGTVNVDGSVAYLSGETGGMYFFSDGSIGSGVYTAAAAGNEIRHLGTTTGPAAMSDYQQGIYDNQTIEFRTGSDVGVLLSGSLGYAPATNAAFGPNGSIVLSANEVTSTGNLTVTSNTRVEAFARVDLNFDAGETLTMGGDANGAYALTVNTPEASLTAGAGGVIDIAGTVALNPLYAGTAAFQVSAAGADGNGDAGGRIDIGGDLTLDTRTGLFGQSARPGGTAEAIIGDGGHIGVGGNMRLLADAYASTDDDGFTVANGGRATVAMTGANASLRVGDVLVVSAQALPFSFNCECSPPGSGLATGGYAALTAAGGTIEIGNLSVSASAESFSYVYAQQDAILDAVGGTALVSLGDSTASFGSVSVSADAVAAAGQGGIDGGNATGGAASFSKAAGGGLRNREIIVTADAFGGFGGGSDGESFGSTRGGSAQGGTVSVELSQSSQGLLFLDLSASARGGDGGAPGENAGESGADGGDAFGGTASLALSGAGNTIADLSESSINVFATGGIGGYGTSGVDGVDGGDGGFGGSARGGSLTITAANGAAFSGFGMISAAATGGEGGYGGSVFANGENGPGNVGLGGNGGNAVGASLTIIADGGTISGSPLLDATGLAAPAGINGYDADGNYTGAGQSGVSTGGAIALTLRDNGAGRFDVGTTQLLASGETAGTISIIDESTDPGAFMRFGSLYAEANGATEDGAPTLRVSAAGNTIDVEGTAELYANSIGLDFANGGGLDVGGFAYLAANAGDVTISHANNPGAVSVRSGSGLDVYATGNYTAEAGSIVASAGDVTIRALGSITAADTSSFNSIILSSQGDVTVGDASAGSDLQLYAGRFEFDGSFSYQPNARATITGTVEAGGAVRVESGGFADFASGSTVRSDNDILVRTGDDILVASGASLVSDIAPADQESIHLLAGDINFGGQVGDLVEPIATPIASLIVRGSLDTNGAALYMSGDAIDATGSSIATGSLYADVTDAPPFGPFSNDGGALGADCRQGSACLGDITATGDVAIGLESTLISLRTGTIDFTGGLFEAATTERLELTGGNLAATEAISLTSAADAIALSDITLEAPDISLLAGTDLEAATATLIGSGNLRIGVGNDIAVGSIFAADGIDDGSGDSTFSAPGNVTVGSLTYGGGVAMRIESAGDLSIGTADSNGNAIVLGATGALFLGSTPASAGSITLDGNTVTFDDLRSSADVAILASQSITGGDIDAGGALVLGGANVTVGQAVSSGALTAQTPGTLGFTSLVSRGGSVLVDADGDVSGGDITAATSASLTGANTVLGTMAAATNLDLRSANLTAASLTAGDDLSVLLSGTATIGNFTSGNASLLQAQSLALQSGSAGTTLTVAARSALSFTTLAAAGDISLTATSALTGGDVTSGGRLTINAASLTLGTAGGATGLSATSQGGASFGSLASSAGSITLDATGAVTAASATAGASVSLAGSSITLGSASFGAGLTLDARTGGIAGSGLYRGAGAVALTASRGIAIGSIDTLGAVNLSAGNDALFAELRSRDGSLAVVAGGAIAGSSVAATGGDPAGDDNVTLTAGGALSLDGRISTLNSFSRAQDDFRATAGGAVAISRAEAGRDLALGAGAGAVSAANLVAGRDLALSGQAVDLAGGTVARNLTARATGGNITGSGLTIAGGAIDLSANGDIAVGSLRAGGGELVATAGGGIGYADLSASGGLSLAAGGAIAGSALNGGGGVTARGTVLALGTVTSSSGDARLDATAGSLSAGAVTAANVRARATGRVTLGAVSANQIVELNGSSIALASANAGGNLTLASTPAGGISAGALSAGGDLVAEAGSQGFSGTTLTASALDLASEGGIAFDAANATTSAIVEAVGSITGGTLTSGGFAALDAGGAIGLTGLTAPNARLRSSGGAIAASGVAVTGTLDATGRAITLAGPDALTVNAQATAGNVGITSGGDLRVNATATGDIALTSTGGSVIIGSVAPAGTFQSGIGTASVGGNGAVTVSARNAITVIDSVTAGGSLTMTAGGLVSLNGGAAGQTIALSAADLSIGANGTLGNAATQRISLASTAPVNLGTGASGGFAVDAAEFARIQTGGDLLVAALAGQGAGAGSLAVGSLTVNAGSGGQLGTNGTFGLTASGVLDINNTLAIARAGAGNSLALTGDAVDLDYASATISVMDSANAATGRIIVNGRLITSLSASAATDIVGKSPDEISLRLGRADVTREGGLFRTSALTLEGRDAILVQNSGGPTVDERRGLTVGALTVTGAADGRTLLVINGVIGGASGVGAAQAVRLSSPVAAGSSVNGCALANISVCFALPDPEPLIEIPDSILFGTSDLIESEEEDSEVEDGVADGKPEAPPIDTSRIDDPAGLPMIDDPVTGAGNEDLWQPPEPQS